MLPFLKYDDEPLFLFNVFERKFILFGQIFWPQDFFIFGLGMLLFIVFIILFTVVFGRVFCGWACPQTIFMEMVFRRIEFWIEGDAQYQMALNREHNSFKKYFKKTLKHLVFFSISFLVSNAFLSYLIGVNRLFELIASPDSTHVGGLIALLVFSLLFYSVFAWMREQVCTTVCPYGRLQGVLLDKDSIIVAYDYKRGETRSKFHKNELRTTGDCIDCSHCIKVCPTGIDIRNGTQLECTNCTACIDACDDIMTKVGLKKGLIRYTSENRILGKTRRVFSSRMKAYVAVLFLLTAVEAVLIVTRKTVDVSVNRTRGLLCQDMGSNNISNLYSIKLYNKKNKPIKIRIVPDGFNGKIQWVGKPLSLNGEGKEEGMFFVIVNKSSIHNRKTSIFLKVFNGEKEIDYIKASFYSSVIN